MQFNLDVRAAFSFTRFKVKNLFVEITKWVCSIRNKNSLVHLQVDVDVRGLLQLWEIIVELRHLRPRDLLGDQLVRLD